MSADSFAEMWNTISTHAPAGGATGSGWPTLSLKIISTHAPAGGATLSCVRSTPSRKFLLTPLREGRQDFARIVPRLSVFLLTPLREGRRRSSSLISSPGSFLLTPLREGRPQPLPQPVQEPYFYSRPCGRGDSYRAQHRCAGPRISTHAPAGGATSYRCLLIYHNQFLLTPLREGRRILARKLRKPVVHFYSRPCGRGDGAAAGRLCQRQNFYSRPCGRGDRPRCKGKRSRDDFYSRPCGRGDSNFPQVRHEVLRQIAER